MKASKAVGRSAIVAFLAACGVCALFGGADAQTAYVDEFDLTASSCGFGKKMQAGKTVDGNAFRVRGEAFTRGFGTHPESAVVFRSNGKEIGRAHV